MVKWLRQLLKNERGQALAEYQVLFPGSILMILATFMLIAEPVKGMYCDAVGMFSNGICAESDTPGGEPDGEEPTAVPTWEPTVDPFSEPDGSTFCHCEQGEGDGAFLQKNCHPVQWNHGHDGHDWDYWSHDGTCSGWHDEGLDGPEQPTPVVPDTEQCEVLPQPGNCSQCDQHPSCLCLPGMNSGSFESEGIQSFVIYAGKEYHIYASGETDDGCYYVNLDDDMVWWERYEKGKDCKQITHLESWYIPLCPIE